MSEKKIGRILAIGMTALLTIVSAIGLASAQNPEWSLEQVDGSGGWDASLAFDPLDGNPSMAFVEDKNWLKFAEWNGSTWEIATLVMGGAPDLAYDSQGRPCMSLRYGASGIRFARRNGTRWTYESVDKNWVGNTTSLAFDLAGNPAIAYRVSRSKTTDLKLARFNGVSWSSQVVQADAKAMWLSLAFDPTGAPSIAYSDDTNADGTIDAVKFARWNGTSWVREIVDSAVAGGGLGISVSLAYDPTTRNPMIAYLSSYDSPPGGPRFAWKSGSTWNIEQIEGIEYGDSTSLAVDGTGRAYVSYIEWTADGNLETDIVKLAWRGAGTWNIEVVETVPLWTYYSWPSALALGPGARPAIAYTRNTTHQMMFGYRASVP